VRHYSGSFPLYRSAHTKIPCRIFYKGRINRGTTQVSKTSRHTPAHCVRCHTHT